jgi:hypothetical protein
MKNKYITITTTLSLAALLTFLTGCDMDQTEAGYMPEVDVDATAGEMPEVDVDVAAGEMPEVDVDYKGGNLPEYDVEFANVDVGMKTKTVEVPKVAVYWEEEQVEVPYINVTMPDDQDYGDPFDQEITVKAMAPGSGYTLNILEMYIEGDDLIVISRLNKASDSVASNKGITIRDTVMVKIPELDVEHYILTDMDDFELDGIDAEYAMNKQGFDVDWTVAKSIYKAQR